MVVTEFRIDIKAALDFHLYRRTDLLRRGTKIYALFLMPRQLDPTEYRFLAKQSSYLVLDYHIHFYCNFYGVFVLTPQAVPCVMHSGGTMYTIYGCTYYFSVPLRLLFSQHHTNRVGDRTNNP